MPRNTSRCTTPCCNPTRCSPRRHLNASVQACAVHGMAVLVQPAHAREMQPMRDAVQDPPCRGHCRYSAVIGVDASLVRCRRRAPQTVQLAVPNRLALHRAQHCRATQHAVSSACPIAQRPDKLSWQTVTRSSIMSALCGTPSRSSSVFCVSTMCGGGRRRRRGESRMVQMRERRARLAHSVCSSASAAP